MNDIEKDAFEKNLKETQRCIDHLIKIIKWLVVLGIVCILSMVAVHGMTLLYLYQYDFSVATTTTTTTTEVDQSTDGGGDANYIGRDGEIAYGKADSEDNDNNDNDRNQTY